MEKGTIININKDSKYLTSLIEACDAIMEDGKIVKTRDGSNSIGGMINANIVLFINHHRVDITIRNNRLESIKDIVFGFILETELEVTVNIVSDKPMDILKPIDLNSPKRHINKLPRIDVNTLPKSIIYCANLVVVNGNIVKQSEGEKESECDFVYKIREENLRKGIYPITMTIKRDSYNNDEAKRNTINDMLLKDITCKLDIR